MTYQYRSTERFWKSFYALPPGQKRSVRSKWRIFKTDPFSPVLGTHRINSLSIKAKHTIHSVVIEGDLRVLFRLDSNVVTTLDVGSHKIYRA